MNRQFLGREKELAWLQERYDRPKGQLLVLYGRRRIGKTETLRQFAKDKEHLFYACTESTDRQQLDAFSRRLLAKNIPAAQYLSVFSSWREAFSGLLELDSTTKRLVIIDEFPYMVKSNPEIPSILQALWDEKLQYEDIMLVLSGSSMSFIEQEVLAEKNPLYGRATGILQMKEMDFFDAVQFFPNYSPEDKTAAYAILGGIPHYLKQFDPSLSLAENIVQNILQKGCVLYSEVEFLMHEELRETAVYNTIISAVALGNTKLSEIHAKTLIEKSKLSSYLRNLIELGIITREFPVTGSLKESSNVQRGLYKITDNYFRFYYAFVYPNTSELEYGGAPGIYTYAVAPSLDEYVSRVFEDISIQYMRKQNNAGVLPFHFTRIGRWWNKTDEIDIMALDADGSRMLLGECKYRNAKTDTDTLYSLMRKFPLSSDAKMFYCLFSKSDFTKRLQDEAGEKGVMLFELKDMVE
ncbi:ATP-binding protein [uncultured Methanocorpusculum sp.]|nr:ATP-binding protein [uncultured Methanocorpusculum sp.]